MRGDRSKLIWIDSSVNTHGDQTRVLVPSQALSAVGNEHISLTLVQFAMRRNWYNVNPSNNTCYLYVNGSYYEVQITPGVYSSFATLAVAFQDALTAAIVGIVEITSAAVVYSPTTRLYQVTFTMNAANVADAVHIRSFAIKGGAIPAGVSLQGAYSDVHEILGGRPLRSATEAFHSMRGAATNVCVSRYPASLNTLDAIYLHLTSLETGNFCSTGHDAQVRDGIRLVETSLFARIPFDDSSFTEVHEVIQFQDSGGDMFQSYLSRKSLDSLDIRVTDARGRSLATMDPTQSDEGLMAFKLCLRWDLFESPTPQLRSHGISTPRIEGPPVGCRGDGGVEPVYRRR